MRPYELLNYWHTLRHLRPRQFSALIARPLKSNFPVKQSPPPPLRAILYSFSGRQRRSCVLNLPTFTCLNHSADISAPAIWNDPSQDRLWLYNLHYFDFLHQSSPPLAEGVGLELMHRWVAENPAAEGIGWDPYPLSLRIVNWIKWSLAGNTLPRSKIESLALQIRHLRRRLEYHLLANHLLANAKALVFAGLFFSGPEADRWLKKGLALLSREIPEQILPDGGHIERSPMYHALVAEDLLDVINLHHAYGHEPPAAWKDSAGRMLSWLGAMTHPDGEIALFNDGALGVAPRLETLLGYGEKMGIPPFDPLPAPLVILPDSGYLRLEVGISLLLLDAAPLGPDYNPGHGHADTLSFEWSLGGRRLVVDSGTSTYRADDERLRQRGTEAHNTVTIDGKDSSEVWSAFRVARRARPFGLAVDVKDEAVEVTCSHDGYRRLPGRPVHTRRWYLGTNRLVIADRISGPFSTAVGRCHFHPDLPRPTLTAPGLGSLPLPQGGLLTFVADGGVLRLAQSTYHPTFGATQPNWCLEVLFHAPEVTLTFHWP